jgi:hypothetical protein
VIDLPQRIRAQLDGWAPPFDGGPPPQFVEILDPGDLTPEQIDEWQQKWGDVLVTADDKSLHILASAPRFYPGFEQMRAGLLAVLEMYRRIDEDRTRASETAYEAGRRWAIEQAVAEIAEALGIRAE